MSGNGNGNENRNERQPTCWVNFVSDKQYAGKEESFRTYVYEPKDFEGVVEYIGEGETKVGKRTFKSRIIILRNGQTKWGFNLPTGSMYYAYVFSAPIEKGMKAKVSYLGTAGKYNLPGFHQNCHLIKIDPVS